MAELNSGQCAAAWKAHIGSSEQDLLEYILEHDGRYNIEDHTLDTDTIILKTRLALYEIPVEETEDIFAGVKTASPDNNRTITVRDRATQLEFTVDDFDKLPKKFSDALLESYGPTWAEEYGSAEAPQ